MASLAAGAALSAAAAGKAFGYNRENYMYDRKMRLETEYQIMEFRIKKAELFRDDVRDIIGLTGVKMDTYLIVNAVQLGFVVMLFCEGRLGAGTPVWLVGCHTLSLAAAFIYLLMSVWLAMHATIAAKSYEVRLLTQLVRLPVPSWSQLEGARTYASTFEKVEPRQMFRVPFAGTQEGMLERSHPDAGDSVAGGGQSASAGGSQSSTGGTESVPSNDASRCFSADPWGLERSGDDIFELDISAQIDNPRELPHIELVREAMQYWQSYDAFARVSMSIGTNQLVVSLAYYVLGYVLVANHAIIASWLAVLLFLAIAGALIRLDMSLSCSEFWFAVFLVSCGPVCTALCTKEWAQNDGQDDMIKWLMPVAYVSHSTWLLFILKLSKIETTSRFEVQLPTGFRSVLYIDVFGWIKDNSITHELRRRVLSAPLPPRDETYAAGPGVQSVRYQAPPTESTGWFGSRPNERPVPMRVDDLEGASKSHLTAGFLEETHKAGFGPSSFVPRENLKGAPEEERANDDRMQRGFKLGDSVMWSCADDEVRRGTVGTIAELPSAEEDTFAVIFNTNPPTAAKHLPGHELKMVEVDKAGTRPWRVFCGATTLLAILWWTTGVLVAIELHGGKFLLVSPLTRDQEDTIVRNRNSDEKPSVLQFGERLVTKWPHENIHALGLACDGGSQTVVASSQFAIYAADLRGDAAGRHVEFKAAPLCQEIEGESLQDVSLQCASQGGSCQAVVLTQQGRQLVKCNVVKPSTTAFLQNARAPSVALIAEEWLNDGDATGYAPPESIRSLSMSSQCVGDAGDCAYVATSGNRIVELRQPSRSTASRKYFPHRLLQAKLNGSGGSMDVVHDRYLALLQEDGQHLQVLDLQKGGAVVDSWHIPSPSKHQSWSAMCAAGDNLYFFSDGQSPQLWRFPVPKELRSKSVTQESQDNSAPQARSASGNSLLQRHSLLHAEGDHKLPPKMRHKQSRTQSFLGLMQVEMRLISV